MVIKGAVIACGAVSATVVAVIVPVQTSSRRVELIQ